MANFEQRGKYKNLMKSRILLAVILLFLLIISKAAFNVYKRERYSNENLEALKAKKENLLARADNLSEEIENLKTDRGKEEALREKFNVVKSGEEVIALVEPKEIATSTDEQGKTFWAYIKSWFK